MKIKRLFTLILALTLCLTLLSPLCAYADDEEGGNAYIPKDPDSYAVIDPAAMQKLVEDYVTAHSLNKSKISVGYCFLDTGDTWYYNGDNWYFGAGVYYVPLMMILAEWESSGKISRDSKMKDLTLGDAERYILVYSNNYYAHQMMGVIGSDKEVRQKYMAYSPLPEEYYDPDFLDYSYFSARFLTDVIKTLYNENERFPNIIENLKLSDNGKYFHGAMQGKYEVAQKYRNYTPRRNVEYNHDTLIIYTPRPFVLTVMTEDMGITQQVMWDMAIIFKDYTLTLDDAYEAWLNRPEETPVPQISLPVGQNQGEGENTGLPGIQLPGFGGTQKPAEGQTDETQPGETQPDTQEPAVVVTEPENTQQGAKENDPAPARRMTVLLIVAAVLVILMLAAVLKPILRRKGKH